MKKNLLLVFISILVCSGLGFSQQKQMNNYRPFFHYSPPKNWVNDPNGLVYLDGEYHLFYQYNPYGDKWGHMSWGHAVSKDLIKWETLPVAIPEYKNSDGTTTMIFSGCIVVDSLNTSGLFEKGFKKGLVAIYTSHIEGIVQHQSIAFSTDKGRSWKIYDKNPILNIGLKDFRDPNVIWLPEKKTWLMSLVKPLEFIVQFYESKDLKTWTLLSEFGKQGDVSKIWECPSLTKVPVENTSESKWVLMISSGHREKDYLAVQYFVGDFDGTHFHSQTQKQVLYVDEGKDFYASIPYYNLPSKHKNPILIGWINDWVYASEVPSSPYRGLFTFPREMLLYTDETGQYKLKQKPIIDKTIPTYETVIKVGENLKTPLAKQNNNIYRLKLKLEIGQSKGFEIKLLNNSSEYTSLSYDLASETLSLDRIHSGKIDFHPKFPSIEQSNLKPEKGIISLDIIVDKSVIEIYGNEGKLVMTEQVFPTHSQSSIDLLWK